MFKTEFVGLAIEVSRSVFITTSKHKGANGKKIFFVHVFYQKKVMGEELHGLICKHSLRT
jgi:ABC-type microcin C transport system permease subunit YejB